MTGPIGRAGATGGVGSVREGQREGTRDETRTSSREGGARGAGDASDRVTISPEALRGLPGGGDDDAGRSGADAGESDDASAAGASGFRNFGEALLVARGLGNALRQDPERAARVHDLVSPARAASLLRS